MIFKPAPLDTLATIITYLTSGFLICLSLFFVFEVPYGWIFSIIMVLIVIVSYLLSPKTYAFEGAKFIIEKVAGTKIVISLNDFEGYVAIPNFTKLKLARTFGNGGLFGYYGMFSTAEYGSINCQLTSLKNVFIIKTKKGTFAVSPREPEKFEEFLKATLSGVTGNITILQPIEPGKIVPASPHILILPLALFVLTIAIILLAYTQLPDQIAIHFDLHGNPDGWGSKMSYLISNIVPVCVLFVLAIIIFFLVRNTTTNRSIPNFLVIVISLIQIFIAYMAFDTYWMNKNGIHLIPLLYTLIGFLVILGILLFIYYTQIVKQQR
jgi:hypothetical protein